MDPPDPSLLEPAMRGAGAAQTESRHIQKQTQGGVLRMHRMRLRWVIPFALAALGMIVIAPSAGAAPNLINSCKNSGTPGAEMGHYPAWPGSQSYLRISSIFNHSTGGSGDFVSSTFTIHDSSNVRYHNGAARTFTVSVGGI